MEQSHVRDIIIENRSKGKQPAEVARLLKDEYGIVKSRESVSAIYNRYLRKASKEIDTKSKVASTSVTDDTSDIIMVNDVLNIFLRGYNRRQICQILEVDFGYQNVDYYDVRNITNGNQEIIRGISRNLVNIVVKDILADKTLIEIEDDLKYQNDIRMKDKDLHIFISMAYYTIIMNNAKNTVAECFKLLNGDTKTVKDLMDALKMNVDMQDIRNRAIEISKRKR